MFKGYPSGSPEIQNLSQIGPRVMIEQQQQQQDNNNKQAFNSN